MINVLILAPTTYEGIEYVNANFSDDTCIGWKDTRRCYFVASNMDNLPCVHINEVIVMDGVHANLVHSVTHLIIPYELMGIIEERKRQLNPKFADRKLMQETTEFRDLEVAAALIAHTIKQLQIKHGAR